MKQLWALALCAVFLSAGEAYALEPTYTTIDIKPHETVRVYASRYRAEVTVVTVISDRDGNKSKVYEADPYPTPTHVQGIAPVACGPDDMNLIATIQPSPHPSKVTIGALGLIGNQQQYVYLRTNELDASRAKFAEVDVYSHDADANGFQNTTVRVYENSTQTGVC